MTELEWWPRDRPGYVFLSRALEKIGAAMDEKWTGTEATTDYVQPLPADRTSLWDRQRADMLLHKHRPDLGRPDFVIGDPNLEITDEHWQIARELAQRLHDEGLPALTRLRTAQDKIIQLSIANELVLQIRRISGGPWRAFQPDWWNVDEPGKLFRRCRIDPDYPFSDRPSWRENNDHWIFATEDSLARVLKQSDETPALRPSPATSRKPKHRQEPVKAILKLIFPGDIPQDMDPGVLAKQVAIEWNRRKAKGEPRFQGDVPSKNTILRAAGLIK